MDDLVSEKDMYWLKAGLAFARKNADYPYRCVCQTVSLTDTKIPRIKDETGKDVTPKPLFPVFFRGAIPAKEDHDIVTEKPPMDKGDGPGIEASSSDAPSFDDMPEDIVEFEIEESDTAKGMPVEKDEAQKESDLQKLWQLKTDESRTWKRMLHLLLGPDVIHGEEALEEETEKVVNKDEASGEEDEDEGQEIGEETYEDLLKSVDPRELTRALSESDPFSTLFDIDEKARVEKEKKRQQEERLKNLEAYFNEWEKAIEDLKREEPLETEDQTEGTGLPVHKKEESFPRHGVHISRKGTLDLVAQAVSIEFARKNITLEESDTFLLLDLPDSIVFPDSVDFRRVTQQNTAYEETLRHYKVEDVRHNIGVQVPKPLTREVSIGTGPLPTLHDNEGMIDEFLYYQTYFEEKLDVEDDEETLVKKVEIKDMESFVKYLEQNQEEFLPVLHYFEKAMNKNSYSELLLACIKPTNGFERNEIPSKSKSKSDVEDSPDLKHLLTVTCDLTENKYPVSSICFNYSYPYYFAAGFDTTCLQTELADELSPPGFIICWDIRHFQVPEIVFHTPEVVTCLEFSKTSPYMLAAGMRHGLLAIFDISKKEEKPQVDNYFSSDRPYGDIGRLRWSGSKERNETNDRTVITCISVDGMLYQWSPGTGARGTVIKSEHTSLGAVKQKEYVDLSPTVNVPYLSLDLKPNDPEICVIGCLTGEVLQCNVFGNAISSQKNHRGPVYEARWSPIVDEVFISCGFDSSICLWEASKAKPSRVFYVRGREPVLDVDWSNTSSTLFGAVTHSKIKIFDMSLNRVSELIEMQQQNPHERFTCIAFFPYGNWFFIGQTNGTIEVYDIVNVPASHDSPETALKSAFLT